MMKNMTLLFAFFGILLCSVGCDKTPKDVPKLVSCTVKVVGANGPIADVNVALFPSEGMNQLTIVGKTDASGVASIKTIRSSYVGNGAPIGKFKVTLNKEAVIPDTKTKDEIISMKGPEADKYDKEMKAKIEEIAKVIPKSLRIPGTTTLSAEVTAAGGEILVADVSKAK